LAVNVPGAGLLRRSAAVLKGRHYREFLVVLGLVAAAAAYVVLRGFDFVPGQQPESAFCASDIGERLKRKGHSEEMLWRGCLIAADTGSGASQKDKWRMVNQLERRAEQLRGDNRRQNCLKFAHTSDDPLAIEGHELDARPAHRAHDRRDPHGPGPFDG
jgi:hypothetical protein